MNIDMLIIWIKKNKWLAVILMIGLFLIPLIIVHLLFKFTTGYDMFTAEWSAGDLIGYIAGFEAFVGTITLGIVSVWQTEKANKTNDNLLELTKESERKSVLPFLSFNSYITKYVGENMISLIAKMKPEKNVDKEDDEFIIVEDTSKRLDLLITELIFTICSDFIKVRSELTKEQEEKISSQFNINKTEQGGSLSAPNYNYTKLKVENCGKGSAINVKCRLYKQDNKGDEFDTYTLPFTLPENKHFDLGLYFDLREKIIGSYTLEIKYYDIYMTEYMQIVPIEISDKEYSIDFFQPQKKH